MPVLTSAHSSKESTGCRAARGTKVPAEGAWGKDVPLDQNPVDVSTPLKGRQPELVNYQSTRLDARRTAGSRGTATLHHH